MWILLCSPAADFQAVKINNINDLSHLNERSARRGIRSVFAAALEKLEAFAKRLEMVEIFGLIDVTVIKVRILKHGNHKREQFVHKCCHSHLKPSEVSVSVHVCQQRFLSVRWRPHPDLLNGKSQTRLRLEELLSGPSERNHSG